MLLINNKRFSTQGKGEKSLMENPSRNFMKQYWDLSVKNKQIETINLLNLLLMASLLLTLFDAIKLR